MARIPSDSRQYSAMSKVRRLSPLGRLRILGRVGGLDTGGIAAAVAAAGAGLGRRADGRHAKAGGPGVRRVHVRRSDAGRAERRRRVHRRLGCGVGLCSSIRLLSRRSAGCSPCHPWSAAGSPCCCPIRNRSASTAYLARCRRRCLRFASRCRSFAAGSTFLRCGVCLRPCRSAHIARSPDLRRGARTSPSLNVAVSNPGGANPLPLAMIRCMAVGVSMAPARCVSPLSTASRKS